MTGFSEFSDFGTVSFPEIHTVGSYKHFGEQLLLMQLEHAGFRRSHLILRLRHIRQEKGVLRRFLVLSMANLGAREGVLMKVIRFLSFPNKKKERQKRVNKLAGAAVPRL